MNKIIFPIIATLFLNMNMSFATHQEIDIIFIDGAKAGYSGKGLSFKGPVSITGNFIIDAGKIVVRGISIDRSLPIDQVAQDLSKSPYVEQAILKDVEDTPDEKLQKALQAYHQGFKADADINVHINYNRGLLKLIQDYQDLGATQTQEPLSEAQRFLCASLYRKALYTEEGKDSIIPLLREAYELSDSASKRGNKTSIIQKTEISFILGLQLLNMAQKQDNNEIGVKFIRESIKFFETAEDMGDSDAIEPLAEGRNFLGTKLFEEATSTKEMSDDAVKSLKEAADLFYLAQKSCPRASDNLETVKRVIVEKKCSFSCQ